jgi:Hint domain-containing protein
MSGASRPIKWLGRRKIVARFSDPLSDWPIRVKAGALDNAPSRDLLLSPDHAILVDDVLIQAGALVNGTSIVRETNVPDTFTYYHIELDDHSLILAENTPAETFVDNIYRLAFDNWDEYEALYPEGKPIVEMPYPRAKAYRQMPRLIRERLAERGAILYGAGAIAA